MTSEWFSLWLISVSQIYLYRKKNQTENRMKKSSFNSMQKMNDNFLLNIPMKQQMHLLLLFVKEKNNTVMPLYVALNWIADFFLIFIFAFDILNKPRQNEKCITFDIITKERCIWAWTILIMPIYELFIRSPPNILLSKWNQTKPKTKNTIEVSVSHSNHHRINGRL